MKRMTLATAALCALAVSGCLSTSDDSNDYLHPSKSVDKMSHEELCAYYAHYRENPDLSASGREIATKQMQAKGCTA